MNATLMTQGSLTDPVNRIYPKRIVPWLDSPQLQEQISKKFDHAVTFTSRLLFPSNTQLDYVMKNIQNKPIYSEASLRNFERDTVDNFVEMIIEALQGDEALRHEFDIEGQVVFYDRANPAESSLENSLEQMHLEEAPQRPMNTGRGRGAREGRGKQAAQGQKRARAGRRRNCRADQFCVHIVTNERQMPAYVVEFKALTS